MLKKYISIITYSFLFLSRVFFSSCPQFSQLIQATPTRMPLLPTSTATPVVAPTLTSTPDNTPLHFKTRVVLSGRWRPDDLVFDPQGHLVFSDFYNGTVSRINANGSITLLLSGLAGPEGLVYLADGTL